MIKADSLIRTLVIDDDIAIVNLISMLLEKKFGDELNIVTATDVKSVLGLIAANQIDLCITDLDMPGSNGLQLLKSLKVTNSLTQVVILTAHPSENAIRSSFALGADDYLLKPIDSDALCEVVQFLIRRLRRYHEQIIFSHAEVH